MGRLQRIFIKPWVFTISAFPDSVGVVADRREPRRVPVGKDPVARSAARRLHRALPERAGGDRAGRARHGWTAGPTQAQAHARVHERALGELAGHPGAGRAARPHARVLPVLRLRPQARSATTSSCAACGAASTSRRCTWTCCRDMPLFDGARSERDRRPARRSRDSDSGVRRADQERSSSGLLRRSEVSARAVDYRLTTDDRLFMLLPADLHRSPSSKARSTTARCARTRSAASLFWPAVLACGALGGATGDQLWFYILRGRIHWLDRYPRLGKYRDRVIAHVHAHETGIGAASAGSCRACARRFRSPAPMRACGR